MAQAGNVTTLAADFSCGAGERGFARNAEDADIFACAVCPGDECPSRFEEIGLPAPT